MRDARQYFAVSTTFNPCNIHQVHDSVHIEDCAGQQVTEAKETDALQRLLGAISIGGVDATQKRILAHHGYGMATYHFQPLVFLQDAHQQASKAEEGGG